MSVSFINDHSLYLSDLLQHNNSLMLFSRKFSCPSLTLKNVRIFFFCPLLYSLATLYNVYKCMISRNEVFQILEEVINVAGESTTESTVKKSTVTKWALRGF